MQITPKRFIELAIRGFDGFTYDITPQEAKALQQEDKLETFCHVEWLVGVAPQPQPKVWAKPDWEIHEDNRKRKTNLNRAMQQKWDKEQRNLNKVVAYLVKTSGLQAKMVEQMARVMLKNNAATNPILAEIGLEL